MASAYRCVRAGDHQHGFSAVTGPPMSNVADQNLNVAGPRRRKYLATEPKRNDGLGSRAAMRTR